MSSKIEQKEKKKLKKSASKRNIPRDHIVIGIAKISCHNTNNFLELKSQKKCRNYLEEGQASKQEE
jgi:hypothetical protein